MNVWFTSDTHYGHTNIIKYAHRPFKDVIEMREKMIENWNALVRQGDIVYHLGDFAFLRTKEEVDDIVKRLVGQKHLICGNHDRQIVKHCKLFADVKDYKEIEVDGQKIVLCHYAFKVWRGSHRGSFNLHGHSHGSLPRDFSQHQMDVGVDCWNYRPISFEEVRAEMKKVVYKPVDRHGED